MDRWGKRCLSVDRGPFGRQVLEFVRNLTLSFPGHVLPLMGNHDLYTLADALLPDGASLFMGAPVKDFSYAFVHPEEYLNWLPTAEQADDPTVLMPALFAALQNVYAQHQESRVMLAGSGARSIFDWPPLRFNETLSSALRGRLKVWQDHASQGLVDTGLAAWLSERPAVAVLGGALFVHGGLPPMSRSELEELAKGFESTAGDAAGFFKGRNLEMLHEALTYRDFHGRGGCKEVDKALELVRPEGVQMIIVGHTAGRNVRKLCSGRLLAADSSLSRFYRAHGNRYCPVQVAADRPGSCARAVSKCAGQASRMQGGVIMPVNMEDAEEEL
ncbi:unnamed protein product [Durusdinium trenchii]|uniref:Calcineurin-like phosphoesterase domain-containing protein n=1 Tax=Durusdinium trenchii TaxID=1381693 RepID=A0ABP0QLM5_9DINO